MSANIDPYDEIVAAASPATNKPFKTKRGALKFKPESSDWSLNRLSEIEESYQSRFGRPLPVRNRGQGAIHDKWGYAHDDSADISLSPNTPEGQFVIGEFERRNYPYLAFDRAIPGVSTGAHIHGGWPSKRKGATARPAANPYDSVVAAASNPESNPYDAIVDAAKPAAAPALTGRQRAQAAMAKAGVIPTPTAEQPVDPAAALAYQHAVLGGKPTALVEQEDQIIDAAYGKGIGYQSRSIPPEERAKLVENATAQNQVKSVSGLVSSFEKQARQRQAVKTNTERRQQARDAIARSAPVSVNDAAWHFGMTPDEARKLSPKARGVLSQAIAEDERKRAAGQTIDKPPLAYQNQMRQKAGIAPLRFNVPVSETAAAPYYQPDAARIDLGMETRGGLSAPKETAPARIAEEASRITIRDTNDAQPTSALYQELQGKIISEHGGIANVNRTIDDYKKIGRDPKTIYNKIEQETQARMADFLDRRRRVEMSESGLAPKMGVFDKIRELGENPAQLVPFLSGAADMVHLAKVNNAALQLERGRANEQDMLLLREFHAQGQKDSTFWYKVADTVTMLPAFVGEFAATGGVFTAAKQGALKGIERIVTKQGMKRLEKSLAGRLATKSIASTAGAAAQTIPAGLTRIPAGVLYRQGEGDDFSEALAGAVADQFIEVASERTGGVLSHIPVPKRLSAIRDALTARWIAKNPSRSVAQLQKVVEQTGWHGVLGEMFEERVGDVARYAIGEQASPLPPLEQLLVEGIAFSIPGAGFAAVGAVSDRRAEQRAIQSIQDTFGVDATTAREILDIARSTATEPEIAQEQPGVTTERAAEIPRPGEEIADPKQAALSALNRAVQASDAQAIRDLSKLAGERGASMEEIKAVVSQPEQTERQITYRDDSGADQQGTALPMEAADQQYLRENNAEPSEFTKVRQADGRLVFLDNSFVTPEAVTPPTPATPRVPELPETLAPQFEAMAKGYGNRKAVILPAGTYSPEQLAAIPKPFMYAEGPNGEVAIFDPSNVPPETVQAILLSGATHTLTGMPNRESPTATIAAVARDSKGIERFAGYLEPGNEDKFKTEATAQNPGEPLTFEFGGRETEQKIIEDRTAALIEPAKASEQIVSESAPQQSQRTNLSDVSTPPAGISDPREAATSAARVEPPVEAAQPAKAETTALSPAAVQPEGKPPERRVGVERRQVGRRIKQAKSQSGSGLLDVEFSQGSLYKNARQLLDLNVPRETLSAFASDNLSEWSHLSSTESMINRALDKHFKSNLEKVSSPLAGSVLQDNSGTTAMARIYHEALKGRFGLAAQDKPYTAVRDIAREYLQGVAVKEQRTGERRSGERRLAKSDTRQPLPQPPLVKPVERGGEAPSNARSMLVNGERVMVELTPENAKKFDALDAELKRRKAQDELQVSQKILTRQDADNRAKGGAMRAAAEKRLLHPDFATAKEQVASGKREATNYVGKKVTVDGQDATVIGNSFGKVKVKLADGSTRMADAADIVAKPIKDARIATPERGVTSRSDAEIASETNKALGARVDVGPERDAAMDARSDAARRVAESIENGDVVVLGDGTRLTVTHHDKRNKTVTFVGEGGNESVLSTRDMAAEFIPQGVTLPSGQRGESKPATIERGVTSEAKQPDLTKTPEPQDSLGAQPLIKPDLVRDSMEETQRTVTRGRKPVEQARTERAAKSIQATSVPSKTEMRAPVVPAERVKPWNEARVGDIVEHEGKYVEVAGKGLREAQAQKIAAKSGGQVVSQPNAPKQFAVVKATEYAPPEKPSSGKTEQADMVPFPAEMGSLGIPRAAMPQVDLAHRGAMTQYLMGRGLDWDAEEVAPNTLKPAQAEYHASKVERSRQFSIDNPDKEPRKILVSSDGYVMDGHHQWMAKVEDSPDTPIPILRLHAPAIVVIPELREFPSSYTDGTHRKEGEPNVQSAGSITRTEATDEGRQDVPIRAAQAPEEKQEPDRRAKVDGVSVQPERQQEIKEAVRETSDARPEASVAAGTRAASEELNKKITGWAERVGLLADRVVRGEIAPENFEILKNVYTEGLRYAEEAKGADSKELRAFNQSLDVFARALGRSGVSVEEEIPAIAPVVEEPSPAKPAKPTITLTEKQRKAHGRKPEKVNRAGFTKEQAAYVAEETSDYAHEQLVKTYGKEEAERLTKEHEFPVNTVQLQGEKETIKVPNDGEFTIDNAYAANKLHQKVTGKPIEGFERAKNAGVMSTTRQGRSPDITPTPELNDLIAAYGGDEQRTMGVLKQTLVAADEDAPGRYDQEKLIEQLQQRWDDKRDPEEVKAPFVKQVNALIEKQHEYKELRHDVIKSFASRMRDPEMKAEAKASAEGFSPDTVLTFHPEDPKSVVSRRITFNQKSIWDRTDLPREYRTKTHGGIDWFRIEAEAKEGIGKFTAEEPAPRDQRVIENDADTLEEHARDNGGTAYLENAASALGWNLSRTTSALIQLELDGRASALPEKKFELRDAVAAVSELPPRESTPEEEPTSGQGALVERIVAVARRQKDQLYIPVKRYTIIGSDGKSYSGDLPAGVTVVERDKEYWVSQSASQGTTHGKRYDSREEWQTAHDADLDRHDEDFRKELLKMSDERLKSQAEYWIPELRPLPLREIQNQTIAILKERQKSGGKMPIGTSGRRGIEKYVEAMPESTLRDWYSTLTQGAEPVAAPTDDRAPALESESTTVAPVPESTYKRTTPAPGTPERAASEQARIEFDQKTKVFSERESEFKEKAQRSKYGSKIKEQWETKARKADDQLNQVYKDYEAQRTQWRNEHLEDVITQGDEANSLSALALLTGDSEGLYEKIKQLGIEEAEKQGAEYKEAEQGFISDAETAAIGASSMIMNYPGLDRSLAKQIETELRVTNQNRRVAEAKATVEALPDLTGKSRFIRQLDQTYGTPEDIERIVGEATEADKAERYAAEQVEKSEVAERDRIRDSLNPLDQMAALSTRGAIDEGVAAGPKYVGSGHMLFIADSLKPKMVEKLRAKPATKQYDDETTAKVFGKALDLTPDESTRATILGVFPEKSSNGMYHAFLRNQTDTMAADAAKLLWIDKNVDYDEIRAAKRGEKMVQVSFYKDGEPVGVLAGLNLRDRDLPSQPGQTKETEKGTALYARDASKNIPLSDGGVPEFSVEGNLIVLENRAAAELLALAIKQPRGSIAGMFVEHPERTENFGILHSGLLAIKFPMLLAPANRMAQMLRDILSAHRSVRIAIPSRIPHETAHQFSYDASGERPVEERHSPEGVVMLTSLPEWEAGLPRLQSLYRNYSLPRLIEEFYAMLMSNQHRRYGLTDAQRDTWLDAWFRSFVESGNSLSPEYFKEISDESNRIRENALADFSRSREGRESVSSVEGRRQGSDEQSVGRAGDVELHDELSDTRPSTGSKRERDDEGIYSRSKSETNRRPLPRTAGRDGLASERTEGVVRGQETQTQTNLFVQPAPELEGGIYTGTAEAEASGAPRQTDTPEFRRWFGNSKVVNPDGTPQVVYHGTQADFAAFDPEAEATTYERDKGIFFFTSDQGDAGSYAEDNGRNAETTGANVMPVYLSMQNPLVFTVEGSTNPSVYFDEHGNYLLDQAKDDGNDGVIVHNLDDGEKTLVAFKPEQIKSAISNRAFDPSNPNILMSRLPPEEDPWAELRRLAEDVQRPAGENRRRLPQTFEAAEMEKGTNLFYPPATIVSGIDRAKQIIAEKGVDGAAQLVLHGDLGIEWAATGFEVLAAMRAQEAGQRLVNPTEADKIAERRLSFINDFVYESTRNGQRSAGINAIAEYAPDRAAYILNRTMLKGRGRGLNQQEEANINDLAEKLVASQNQNKALEEQIAYRIQIARELEDELEAAEARARRRESYEPGQEKDKPKRPRAQYEVVLDEQANAVKDALMAKIGNFNFGNLKVETRFPSQAGKVAEDIAVLPEDAELLAQYTASQLSKHDTVADLNQHLTSTFGAEVEPVLSAIRQRAFQIRKDARAAEMAAKDTGKERRRTILSEIQTEIAAARKAVRDLENAHVAAEKERKASEERARKEAETTAKKTQKATEAANQKQQRQEAREAASRAQKEERQQRLAEIREARRRLEEVKKESVEASQAETKGWRGSLNEQKKAARAAMLWDTPLRKSAEAARVRLAAERDPADPEVMEDIVAVAAAKFLPDTPGGNVRTKTVDPSQFYVELKDEFPDLVTKKNQREIYRRAFERVKDTTTAAREAAKLRSASKESKAIWDILGVDADAQALLIQRAKLQREQHELRRKMQAEFKRASRTPVGTFLHELGSLPRALQSSVDAPVGRQGLLLAVLHPVEAMKGMIPATIKGYTSDIATPRHLLQLILHPKETWDTKPWRQGEFQEHILDLESHPDFELAHLAALDLPQVMSDADRRVMAEEDFQSAWGEKFPHVRLSEQGFILGMNTARVIAFSRMAAMGRSNGYTWENNPVFFRQAAALVNAMTGRANMPDIVKRMSTITNILFYSTRLNMSRIQVFNQFFNPIKYLPTKREGKHLFGVPIYNPFDSTGGGIGGGGGVDIPAGGFADDQGGFGGRGLRTFDSHDPVMRRIMAGELLRGLVAVLGFYLLCRLLGLSIELDDLDSADWGKLRWGNARYDITGGHAATLRALLRFTRGVYEYATTDKKDRDSKHDPWEIFKEFSKYKFGPWPSFFYSALYGEDVIGQPANFKFTGPPSKVMRENILIKLVSPMTVGDFEDGMIVDGWVGTVKTIPALWGTSVQTYPFKDRPSASPAQKLLQRRSAGGGFGDEEPEDRERRLLIRQLEDDIRAGKDVKADIEAAVKSGKLKPDDPKTIARDGQLSIDQLNFKRASIKNALDAYELMSEEERKAVRQLLADKGPNIQNLRETEQDEVAARFEKLTGKKPDIKRRRYFTPKWQEQLKKARPSPTP